MGVAPHAGAWIEINLYAVLWQGKGSLPTRERGLKCKSLLDYKGRRLSLPTRERGLKYSYDTPIIKKTAAVAPHAGAWIEMIARANRHTVHVVAPHAGAWIEISCLLLGIADAIVAPHAGAWIEIRIQLHHSLRSYVAPHAGAWIEMLLIIYFALTHQSLPTRERGLKYQRRRSTFGA